MLTNKNLNTIEILYLTPTVEKKYSYANFFTKLDDAITGCSLDKCEFGDTCYQPLTGSEISLTSSL